MEDSIKELQGFIQTFESFLEKFVDSDLYGKILKTDDDAQVKRKIIEVSDYLNELFGKNNHYTVNIINAINTPTMSSGPSYASIQDVIGILQAASTKIERGKLHKIYLAKTGSDKNQNFKKQDTQNHLDLGELSIPLIFKRLNAKELYSLIIAFITIISLSFGLGYKIHSWKSDKDLLDITVERNNLKNQLKKLQNSSNNVIFKDKVIWSGVWEIETQSFKNARIKFIQSNGNVSGKYKYFATGLDIEGQIEGQMNGNTLDGKWTEYKDNKKIEGLIYFVMSYDNKSFTGRYTRQWENNKIEYVWKGIKVN